MTIEVFPERTGSWLTTYRRVRAPVLRSITFFQLPYYSVLQATSVERSDFRTIEHRLRAGGKKLKLLSMPGVRAAQGLTVERR